MFTLKNTELLEITPYKPHTKYLVKWRKRQQGMGDQVINWNGLRSFVHREVLLASSDYFKVMFSGNFRETNQAEITLSMVFDDINVQNAVIDYMYNGNIILSFTNILNILNVASLFLMPNLQEACVVFLKSNLSPMTSLHIYTLADRYNLLGLQAACMEVIVPWFPVNLWKSDMALNISPHCLVSLVEGHLFELVPDDMSTTFLRNWCVNFESMNDIDAESIPQKVKDLLRHRQLGPTEVSSAELLASMSTPRQDCREYEVQLEGGEEEDEVLYTVFTSPPTNSCKCNVEVHALIPLLKKWKLVLRHSFNFFVKSTAVPSLLGVTKTAAFFLLRAMDMKPRMDCIIAVTLEKSEEIVINVPERLQTKSNNYEIYGRNACFFLWDEQLCMIVSVYGMTFGLYRNVHVKGQCVGCVGECWDMLCGFQIDNSAEYLVKTYKGELYVWTKQYAVVGHMLTHMNYTMSKVQKFPNGEYKVILLSGARNGYSITDGSTEQPQTDLTVMCDIIADPKADTLTFIHVVRKHLRDGDLIDSWQNSHAYRQMTYSVSDDTWRTDMDCTLDYPDPPSLIKTWRKYKTSLPLQQSCKRLVCSSDSDSETTDESDSDHEYFNQRVKKKGPEICVGGLYYAKTTSAYNSSVWRLQPILRKWTLVGRLPYSLERFKNCLRSEASKDWLSELPDSHFRDFSPELGQNASWMPEIAGTGMRATFYSNLLSDDLYAKRWSALWQECYAQK